jgi:predicted MFS family arabinose efflux permease
MLGTSHRGDVRRTTAWALALTMFAAQSALFVLTPLLPLVATAFGVPVSAVGQLRTISGLVAALSALVLGPLARRLALSRLLVLGLILVAGGSLLAGLAPAFAVLAASQVAVGAGLAVSMTASLAACAQWAPPGGRARMLSWAMMGPPAAAIVTPLVSGALAAISWRLAWSLVPTLLCGAALVALRDAGGPGTVAGRSEGVSTVIRLPRVAPWAVGELLAYAGWSVVIVYSGALLVESYGVGELAAAAAIAASAAAFMLGNRAVHGRAVPLRVVLLVLAVALAACGWVFGTLRIGFWASAAALATLGLLAGGRSLAGSRHGLDLAGDRPVAGMALRTLAQQLGYTSGAAIGGVVLAGWGYSGLGWLLAVLFTGAALPHLGIPRRAAFPSLAEEGVRGRGRTGPSAPGRRVRRGRSPRPRDPARSPCG